MTGFPQLNAERLSSEQRCMGLVAGHRAILPLLLVALAALTMSFHLANKSLWNDEAFSFFVARGGPSAAVRFIAQDTHPPIYYLALSLWLRSGDGVLALRSLSVLALVLAVLPLYGAAQRLFDTSTAAAAGLFFALSPLIVDWAQKARPYAVQTCLLSVAFWGFAEVYCADAARREWIGQGALRAVRTHRLSGFRTDLAWLAVAVGGGFAMLAQQPAGFFLLGLNVAILLGALQRRRSNYRWLINWAVSQLLLVGVWLVWFPWFLRQIMSNLTPDQIAARHSNFLIDRSGLLVNLEGIFGIGSLWHAALPFLALLLSTATIGAVLLVRVRRAVPVLVPILVPICVCTLGFLLIHPVFGYIIADFAFLWIPYTMLIGYAVAHLRPRLLRAGLLGMIVLGEVWGLHNYYLKRKPAARCTASRRGRAMGRASAFRGAEGGRRARAFGRRGGEASLWCAGSSRRDVRSGAPAATSKIGTSRIGRNSHDRSLATKEHLYRRPSTRQPHTQCLPHRKPGDDRRDPRGRSRERTPA